MNFKFNYLLILAFFALLSFNSCQDEVLEVTETDEETLIAPNSTLANLMQYTVTNDGSVDNIMDNSNCFSVNLPVTIIVNDITITINTLEDLALIEEIFDEFDSDDDVLEFLFPITIILNDYEEIVIENESQLEAFIENCIDDEDDVIECIDFHYPISFSIYNTDFQVIDTVVIESDEHLYEFLENLQNENDQAVLASLNFPVTMVYANGNTVEVNNNVELQAAIQEAEDDCDDDNEEDDCTKEEVDAYLTECHWNIVNFNGDDNFINKDIYFNNNGSLEIYSENNVIATGNWSTSMSNLGVVLTLSELTMFDGDLGGEWYVYECDDDRFKFTRVPGTIESYFIIERECDNQSDCSVAEIHADLKECKWYIGSDLVDGNGPLMFTEDGVKLNGNIIGGWNLALIEGYIYLTLDLSGDYMNISREWKLVECDDDRLQFISGDHTLVLEQECANTNPFECYSNLEFGICDDGDEYDGIATFNLNEIYPDCNEDNVEVSFHATEGEAHNNVNALSAEYTNTTNNQELIYVRVALAGTNEYEIFVVLLYVEDCSVSGCTEEELDSYLMEFECYWVAVSVDGSNAFDDFAIQFNENQDLLIEGGGANYFGTWSTAGNPANGVFLTIAQLENNVAALNGQWLVTECGPERIVLVEGDRVIVIERECP